MAPKDFKSHRSFKQLEQKLTYAVFVDLALFVFTLIAAGKGILWLKILLGLLTIALSGAGCAFLVMINEHHRSRSLWILTAFGALLACTVVSFITGYPAPVLS